VALSSAGFLQLLWWRRAFVIVFRIGSHHHVFGNEIRIGLFHRFVLPVLKKYPNRYWMIPIAAKKVTIKKRRIFESIKKSRGIE
jgi:hypothetical protein